MYTQIDEVSEVTLSCEIYGYPRDSSPPVWTSTSDELQSGRFTTAVTDVGPLNGSSISTTERVVSQLTINNVTEGDSGEYTCSVQGNSTTVTLALVVEECDNGKHFQCFCHSKCILYIFTAGSLIGGVVGLAVLLLISLTINILAMIYCIYQLRVKSTQSVGERGNEEKLYEQVDDQQHMQQE